MKERPILFSGPMVRALLAGTKTQTRRVVKPHQWVLDGEHMGDGSVVGGWEPGRYPYGVPGDRLWVRETWKAENRSCNEEQWIDDDHVCSAHCKQRYIYYRATPRKGYRPLPDRANITYLDESSPLTPFYETDWRPSIFMRREDSRIALEVTHIRVQRVQDIGEDDARSEGMSTLSKDGGVTWKHGIPDRDGLPGTDDDGMTWAGWSTSAVAAFSRLWDRINAKRGYGWSGNPWVWAISFKRVTP